MMMATMMMIIDYEDIANDDDPQSTGSQRSSPTIPSVQVDPSAQGLLHWRQGQHHSYPFGPFCAIPNNNPPYNNVHQHPHYQSLPQSIT